MDLIENALTSRAELLRQYVDPRRDIGDECGHPKFIKEVEYKDMYDREPIATRIVEVYPRECWQVQPTVSDEGDVNSKSPFEEAIGELGKNLRGESWFKDEDGNPLWEHLKRLDELSGIGYYGVLLIGFNDIDESGSLADEVKTSEGLEIIFLRTFDSSLVNIDSRETDTTSPRFGHPTMYTINFEDPRGFEDHGINVSTNTEKVHHSRIIHVADNLGVSEIFGPPRLQSVFNRVLDLHKLYGGSAEMYWRGAFPGLSFETHPQLGGDVTIDSSMRDEMEDYMNGLQRFLALTGMSAKSLAPQVVDPAPQIDVQITAICIRLGIPKRKFMGTERGELSSSMDDDEWNDKVKARQLNYVTPRIIVPFIDRLIALRVLPEPSEGGYTVNWPDIHNLSDQVKAEILMQRIEAMSKFVGGGVENIMSLKDFYVREIGYSEEEADSIIDNIEPPDELPLDGEMFDEPADEFQPEPEEGTDTGPNSGGDQTVVSGDKEQLDRKGVQKANSGSVQ